MITDNDLAATVREALESCGVRRNSQLSEEVFSALAALKNQIAELSEAIPIVTDGRFDADSAIEHLRRYKDDNW